MSLPPTIQSPICDLLKIKHPVLLAGMANIATSRLAAAVSNAGGLGVIGGFTMTPGMLRKEISKVKEQLVDKTAFGVDLLLPQVGGGARKTNTDYTRGKLDELIDIIIENKARLFVSAVGVPPQWVVDKLHKAGILVMNMVGAPSHVDKALERGVDLICAQGYEAGGHSGSIATMVLIPQCVDRCRGKTSPLTGDAVHVIAAGGIYDGRTMAAALALGAEAVWVGTRFVACEEATGTKMHKQALLKAGAGDTTQSVIYTGRPARVLNTDYVKEWEGRRRAEKEELLEKGVVPFFHEVKTAKKKGEKLSIAKVAPLPFGQACGGIDSILPAATIMDSMVSEAAVALRKGFARL